MCTCILLDLYIHDIHTFVCIMYRSRCADHWGAVGIAAWWWLGKYLVGAWGTVSFLQLPLAIIGCSTWHTTFALVTCHFGLQRSLCITCHSNTHLQRSLATTWHLVVSLLQLSLAVISCITWDSSPELVTCKLWLQRSLCITWPSDTGGLQRSLGITWHSRLSLDPLAEVPGSTGSSWHHLELCKAQ